jgi:lipopolysaccharide biosynthesis protein
MTKRLCLFAGYHKLGLIADYAAYYVKEMGELADVYYQADCAISAQELSKLAPYTKGAFAYRHKKYDFGSWQELINRLGWDFIEKHDELILCNDSCFGPLFPLKPIFDKASRDTDCDFWGVQENYFSDKKIFHLDSFFLVFKNKILRSRNFRGFFASIAPQDNAGQVVEQYEVALTPLLTSEGFRYKCLFPHYAQTHIYRKWKSFIKRGCPFLKVRSLTNTERIYKRESLFNWRKFLKQNTSYDTELIKKYLPEVGANPDNFNSFSFGIKSFIWALTRFIRYRIFRFHFGKDGDILTVLGFCLINKNVSGTLPVLDNTGELKEAAER